MKMKQFIILGIYFSMCRLYSSHIALYSSVLILFTWFIKEALYFRALINLDLL